MLLENFFPYHSAASWPRNIYYLITSDSAKLNDQIFFPPEHRSSPSKLPNPDAVELQNSINSRTTILSYRE